MTISSKPVIAIARQAGEAIIQHLQPGLEVIVKADESPVTQADLAAHTIVMHGLAGIDPAIPIMSEEGTPEEKQAAHRSHRRWIVDPLDGSKTSIEYAKGKLDEDGFGVHIALIEDDIPVLGVAYFPAKGNGGVLYYTGDDGRAYRQEGTEAPKRIRTSGLPMSEPLKAAVS